jgi:hypothetical protein
VNCSAFIEIVLDVDFPPVSPIGLNRGTRVLLIDDDHRASYPSQMEAGGGDYNSHLEQESSWRWSNCSNESPPYTASRCRDSSLWPCEFPTGTHREWDCQSCIGGRLEPLRCQASSRRWTGIEEGMRPSWQRPSNMLPGEPSSNHGAKGNEMEG